MHVGLSCCCVLVNQLTYSYCSQRFLIADSCRLAERQDTRDSQACIDAGILSFDIYAAESSVYCSYSCSKLLASR
jgi:hypothetical protein